MPYEELPHTADWALRVWAPDLPSLFVETARGMNMLSGIVLPPGARITHRFEANGPDNESLLVAFLTELIYFAEQENTGFDVFAITITGSHLEVDMEGALLKEIDKSIKAVTYHNLNIQSTERGLEIEIVFDV